MLRRQCATSGIDLPTGAGKPLNDRVAYISSIFKESFAVRTHPEEPRARPPACLPARPSTLRKLH